LKYLHPVVAVVADVDVAALEHISAQLTADLVDATITSGKLVAHKLLPVDDEATSLKTCCWSDCAIIGRQHNATVVSVRSSAKRRYWKMTSKTFASAMLCVIRPVFCSRILQTNVRGWHLEEGEEKVRIDPRLSVNVVA
jgi:hypothetical protein